jgi:hypothetical protein
MKTCGVLFLLLVAAPAAAQQFDPAYRFRALPTEHFVIYFHQGEDRLAARLAVIAEETWRALEAPLGTRPPARTHVILVDPTDSANGWATPLPRDTIAIYAVWPAGSDLLRTDDWLRIVFTHEFTHIVHLDRSEGWARIARNIFGRMPLAFPNLFLPTWQIEGLAVYEESAITHNGRLEAGDFRAIVDEAARARRLEPLDRVNGGLTDWPGGGAQYAYGASFHKYLADLYGVETLATLARETARSLPYLAETAFKRVYGKSLGTLWREYEASVLASTTAATTAVTTAARTITTKEDNATRLTHHNFMVSGPRFAPPSCPSCAPELYYSVVDADHFPALYRLRAGGTPERVITRFLGATTGPGRDTIYFDELDVARNAGLYSDLHALDRATRGVRRVTTGARLVDPDLSPDARTIVAAQNWPGRRDLVLVHLDAGRAPATIATLVAADDTQFNAPRWSPDGRLIVAERQQIGRQPELVVVDPGTREVRVIASDPAMRWVTPGWRPDGRAIVAAADRDAGPFNLYELDLVSGRPRQLTHTTGGATWPAVSPDGKTIVYVGYTADGFDLFQIPYLAAGAAPDAAGTSAIAFPPLAGQNPTPPIDLSSARPYSPWSTLWPTSWSPVIERPHQQTRVGAAVAGWDVLAYHFYSAQATWGMYSPVDAPAGSGSGADWSLAYVYARWQPQFWVTASRESSFYAPEAFTLQERKLEAGVTYQIAHVRATQTLTTSFLRAVDHFTFPGQDRISVNRSAARGGWSLQTAHRYGNSISAEGGIAAGATAELVRRGLGSAADATTVTGDARAYLPGIGEHHVIAVRFAGGSTTGDRNLGRVFLLGGAGPNGSVIDFGSSAFSLLRGFPSNTFGGTRIAVANVDYRWPIAKIERGLGTWPIFLHTIHAAVFVDAGHAWTPPAQRFSASDIKTSIGAELSADFILAYRLPLTATFGAAWGRDGSRLVANGATVYLRIGRAF